MESRTRGSRPRTRTQKESEAKTKDRPSRSQGQECSRPRAQAQVFSKKRKKGSSKIFSGVLQKKSFQKNFSGDLKKQRSLKFFLGDLQNFIDSKNSAVLEPRTGQFSRPRLRTSKCVLEDSASGKTYTFLAKLGITVSTVENNGITVVSYSNYFFTPHERVFYNCFFNTANHSEAKRFLLL